MEQSGKLGTIGNELSGRIRSKKRGFDKLATDEIHSRRGESCPEAPYENQRRARRGELHARRQRDSAKKLGFS